MKQSKSKNVSKGNHKISDFFSRIQQPPRVSSVAEKSISVTDSEDFIPETPSSSNAKHSKDKENRKCITAKHMTHSLKHVIKKRKIQETTMNNPPYTIKIEDSPVKIRPSRSECEGETTMKQIISVKSPEKLLTLEALKEYRTPEKQFGCLQNKDQSSPIRILFNELEPSESEVVASCHTKIHKISTSKEQLTPVKNSFNKDKGENTPLKGKKTPKKLFEKSPNNLDNFNVEIIDSFVKLTPSRNSIGKSTNDEVIFVKSSEKRQSLILNYMSSSPSPKSLQAQSRNECTPTKHISQNFKVSPSTSGCFSKVKTKLNFTPTKTKQIGMIQQSLPVNNGNNVNVLNNTTQETSELICPTSYNFDDSWDKDLNGVVPEYNLDLTKSQHCKIVAINPFSIKSVLTLKSTKTEQQAICNLEGFWVHSMLSIGDTVHVHAKKLNDIEWLINNDYGLLVYEPDLLISTTSVVNSVWCKRRSVLQERFRGFEPTNEAMLIGTLVHSLIQAVLKTKMMKRDDIKAFIKKLIREPSAMRSLYEADLTVDYVETEMMKFIANIEDFISLYLEESNKTFNTTHKKDDWTGKIKNIEDIEENIWCPELGLKGKVDVTVKTNFNVMPLEIKTGRATVSLEHKGQVMMYVMMMNKLGYNVPSGLLLYIREGVLREISTTEKEKRDLLLLRNELTYYLMRKPKIVHEDESNMPKLFPPDLPEPINHPTCQKCPYNTICVSYAKYNDENISSNKILKGLQDEILQALSDTHLNYFMKWISLLAMEASSHKSSKQLWDIFTLTPQQRDMNGRSIINLKVLDVGEEMNGVYEHIFEKINDGITVNLYANGIMEGNYVVVSTDTRPAIASGFVTDITVTSVSITLDRNLNKKYVGCTFHIDTYDSSSISSFNLASLALLLEQSPKANKLRKIIIDKLPPTFKTTLPKIIATKGKTILKRLNIVQQRAVLNALASEDYFLIKGMPGTGKTSTIVALIQLLYELNKNILITSHTHAAVDNVCIKLLQQNIKVLRLGLESRIDPKLQEFSEHKRTRHCKTPEELHKIYNDAQVVAVTCLGSGHPLLTKRAFDICIIDESTQVIQSSVIRPLYSAKTFVLIGDQDQLPPVVKDKNAIQMGMSESLFERLYTKSSSVALNLNYRMNSNITTLANEVTYNGELQIGSDDVGKATINIPNKEVLRSLSKESYWLSQALDDSLEKSVQIIDTGPVWNMNHTVSWKINVNTKDNTQDESFKNLNIYEAAIIVKLVQTLLQAGVSPKDIAVIVTYRVQGVQISDLLKGDNVNVSTVDQFQGKDRSIIIYSCSKSRKSLNVNNFKFELLEDKRRLTVAITRAKHKLLIVGDVSTLQSYSTFTKLIPFLKNNTIRLTAYTGFKWDSVLNI